MAVPTFNEFILPVLQKVGEMKTPIHRSDLMDLVCDAMKISQKDRKEYTKGERRTKVKDRISWACTYMVHAGLLYRPRRGHLQITKYGQKILKLNLPQITRKNLYEMAAEPNKFLLAGGVSRSKIIGKRGRAEKEKEVEEEKEKEDKSPTDIIEGVVYEIKKILQADLMNKVMKLKPDEFEKLILDLVLKMGYGDRDASKHTGKSRDGGFDGIVQDNRLGLGPIYLQAKRYARNQTVSVTNIRAFIGAMDGKGSRGVFVTTSSFSEDAKELAKECPKDIKLISGDELIDFMMRFEIGVSTDETYVVQRLDESYFNDWEDWDE